MIKGRLEARKSALFSAIGCRLVWCDDCKITFDKSEGSEVINKWYTLRCPKCYKVLIEYIRDIEDRNAEKEWEWN